MRRFIALISSTLLVFVSLPAWAAIQNYQESPNDSYTETGTPKNFDITNVSYGEFSDSPEFHYFFIDFASKLTAAQFNDNQGSWAAIMIDLNGDNKEDYRIETRQETLQGSYGSPAFLWNVNTKQEVESCSTIFYTDLDEAVQWLGFKLPYSCLKLPTTFGIQAYSDYIEDDDAAFDYTPESIFFKVSHRLSSSVVNPKFDQPTLVSEALYSVPKPGSVPDNLVALSPQVLKSVVTIFCGEGLGTGWAAKTEIPASATQQGMKTFLVTNHHVIEDCLFSGEVTLTDNAGNSAIGYILTADQTNDLAGIYTSMVLPTLSFRGETPAQGWWAGVLGSPRGIEGYLTTGLVSKVAADGSEFAVSASLNPGNSGGPIFDREGRVMGVATYKILDSESLGFAKSVTLLCVKVIRCDSALPIWSSSLVPKNQQDSPDSATKPIAKTATVPSFSGSSSRLTSAQQNSINRLLILNSWANKFICSGIVSTKATTSQKNLARARAKSVCDFAKKQNPSLSTFYQVKTSTSKSVIGKVMVTLRN